MDDKDELKNRYVRAISLSWQPNRNINELLSLQEMTALVELDKDFCEDIVEIADEFSQSNQLWVMCNFYRAIAAVMPGKVKKWEETTLNFDFLVSRVRAFEYYSFDIFNRLAESPFSSHRILAISMCDNKTLSVLTKDSNVNVRKEALLKMGPKMLDAMLEDSRCEIREAGVIMAPIGYPKLSEMIDDLSIRVIRHLVKKVDAKELVYILGNRNFKKSNNVRIVIETRLNGLGEGNG